MTQGDDEGKALTANQLTCWPSVNALLRRLAAEIRLILNPTGLYLYGSLKTGDFDPKNSDVDLMAAAGSEVTDRPTDRVNFVWTGA